MEMCVFVFKVWTCALPGRWPMASIHSEGCVCHGTNVGGGTGCTYDKCGVETLVMWCAMVVVVLLWVVLVVCVSSMLV